MADAFHASVRNSSGEPTAVGALGVFAKVCHAELNPRSKSPAASAAATQHPYCSYAAASGMFAFLYKTLEEGFKVSHSWEV